MSQASTTMATTTTPPVTVVYSGTSSLLMMVTMASTLMELPAIFNQHDVVLPPLLILRDTRGVGVLAIVPQQQPQFQMPLQVYANYAMGPPHVNFFSELSLPPVFIICIGVCSGVCFLLSGAMLDAIFTNLGSTIGICTNAAFWSIPMAGIHAAW